MQKGGGRETVDGDSACGRHGLRQQGGNIRWNTEVWRGGWRSAKFACSNIHVFSDICLLWLPWGTLSA
eukprot:8739338-Pyramimonas_sp.AAC.1